MAGDISRGIQGALTGARTGIGIGQLFQTRERTELMKQQHEENQALDKVRIQVQQRANELEATRQSIERGKMGIELMSGFVAGQEDITPNQMDNIIKTLKDQTGFDSSAFFTPNKDPNGVIKSYSMESVDSMKNKIDKLEVENNKKIKMAELAIRKIEATEDPLIYAQSILEKNTDYQKALETGDYEKASDMAQKVVLKFPGPMSAREPVSKRTSGAIEEDILSIGKKIRSMSTIAQNYSDSFLEYEGKIRGKLLQIKDSSKIIKKLSPLTEDEKRFLNQQTKFETNTRKLHSQYVHDMSGAQVSVKEMDRRLKEMFNVKMSPEQFKSAYNDYISEIKKNYRLLKIAKEQGLTGQSIGQKIDELHGLSEDPSLNDNNIIKVGEEFQAEYRKLHPEWTDQQVLDAATIRLMEMGYIK